MNDDGYEVIVVGSGAAGGMSAYILTSLGVKVLMLEAGRRYTPQTETPMFSLPREAPLRGASTPDKEFGFYDATVGGGWQVPGEPYTVEKGSEFGWFRARMLGGRTNHWARHVPRFGPYDFKPYSRDGLGVDWPFTYDVVAPYYDKVEQLIGVFGTNEDLENIPKSSPGILHPPPKARVPELLFKAACDDLGIPCIPARRAVNTRPVGDRPACFYATDCYRGCSIGANFQSTTVLLPPAEATGNLTVVTDAMVYEVISGDDGRARGVRYIDKRTGEKKSVYASAVVLAASACESARILLSSKSRLHTNGIGNGSGQVGKNLLDTVGTGVGAQFPILEGRPRYNEDGVSFGHLYVPWWLYEEQKQGKLDFARGYHLEMDGDWTRIPDSDLAGYTYLSGNYGNALKRDIPNMWGSSMNMGARGEMIPNENCYCELDTRVKDKWGMPVLKFHWQWGQQELNQVKHMIKTLESLVERMGGRYRWRPHSSNPKDMISKGGSMIHEVGTTRMGSDPEKSVVNEWGQTWDADNVFVMDGGIMASNPDKNPTLTIMALAWRNSEFLAKQIKSRRL